MELPSFPSKLAYASKIRLGHLIIVATYLNSVERVHRHVFHNTRSTSRGGMSPEWDILTKINAGENTLHTPFHSSHSNSSSRVLI